MTLPANKTKIVCTIGPASDFSEILQIGEATAGNGFVRITLKGTW
jgi:pyruvate kinase